MTTPVTPAEVEALEALYAKTDQGAMWFAADFLDSWTPQASAYIAAALNAMPRLLAALRAQDAGVERAAFEAWYDRNRDDGPNMVLSHSMAEKAWFARAALKEADAPRGGAVHPCAKCGVLRTEAEGGTTFTVCDECWDATHPSRAAQEPLPRPFHDLYQHVETGRWLELPMQAAHPGSRWIKAKPAAQEPPRAKPADGGEGAR